MILLALLFLPIFILASLAKTV